MIKTLPYTALRAFEAVVRTQGFGRAADELGISQSAVSQHVRVLEEWTGRRLLIRGPRTSKATADGQRLADAIEAGIGKIQNVCEQLRKPDVNERKITVSCPAGFAVNWLFPRLVNFDQDHPNLPVSILTDTDLHLVTTGEANVAIVYGMGAYTGLHVEHLIGERLFPVCAPMLLVSGPPLRSIQDLSQHTWLVDDIKDIGGNPPTWQYWAGESNITLPEPARIRRFSQSNMVVMSAIQGVGIGLGREPVVIDALVEGKLVRPFPETALSQFSYWFVCSRSDIKSEKIRLFRDWLIKEANATPALPEHLQW